MIIKKYIVKDMREAHLAIKSDLGNDAIILYTQKVKKRGLMNLFAPRKIEVVAALDKKEELRNDNFDIMRKDLELIKEKLNQNEPQNETKKASGITMSESLINLGIDPGISEKIYNEFIGADIKTLKKSMIRKIGCASPLKIDAQPTKVLYIGTTGVGKTTTLAKMAANYVLNFNKDIAIITSDTYRIGAADQLKIYADMLNVPFKVINNNFELSLALKTFADKDMVFIDTPGRSQNSDYQMQSLKNLVNNINFDEIFLVIDVTARAKDIGVILKEFSFLNYKILFTKIDEVVAPFSIIETRYMTNAPFSYITFGQNVPDDIELINPVKVIESIIKEDDTIGSG